MSECGVNSVQVDRATTGRFALVPVNTATRKTIHTSICCNAAIIRLRSGVHVGCDVSDGRAYLHLCTVPMSDNVPSFLAGLQKLALAADLTLGSSTGSSSTSVPINQPPSCTGGPASCLAITTLADTFPSQGWDDSDALQFVFGTLQAAGGELKPRSAPGLATSFTFRSELLKKCAFCPPCACTQCMPIRATFPCGREGHHDSLGLQGTMLKLPFLQLAWPEAWPEHNKWEVAALVLPPPPGSMISAIMLCLSPPFYCRGGLDVGVHLLAVCAVDEWGAAACASQSVTVHAPSASTSSAAMVAASVAAINVTELAGSGDAGGLQDAARQLASVVAFAASSGSATDASAGAVSAMADSLMAAMATNLDTQDTEQVRTTVAPTHPWLGLEPDVELCLHACSMHMMLCAAQLC
jgi:hypothetical protein